MYPSVCVCVCITCLWYLHPCDRLLQDGTWAANPDVSGNRRLITSPCPAGYCKCEGLSDLTRSGCALKFSESICVADRKGTYINS